MRMGGAHAEQIDLKDFHGSVCNGMGTYVNELDLLEQTRCMEQLDKSEADEKLHYVKVDSPSMRSQNDTELEKNQRCRHDITISYEMPQRRITHKI